MRRLVLACALLPAACATQNPLPQPAATGVAVGTIASDGRCEHYTLYVAELDSGRTYRIEQDRGDAVDKLVPLFAGREARADIVAQGAPFAVEMPVGRYELKGWQLGCGASVIRSQSAAAVEFRVEPGQSIYLGSYQFRETTHIGALTTGGSVTLREQAARDLPLIHAAFPEPSTARVAQRLAPGTVIERLGDGGGDGSASFVSGS
ncbi:hypothetical protein [Solimonas soli]|uniref:hypothetical protein n=1 Tax=Solimonas soli TaxID=413479 RepID=UPI0004851EF5|nr:hypothetical protein [Solimonas soli]